MSLSASQQSQYIAPCRYVGVRDTNRLVHVYHVFGYDISIASPALRSDRDNVRSANLY